MVAAGIGRILRLYRHMSLIVRVWFRGRSFSRVPQFRVELAMQPGVVLADQISKAGGFADQRGRDAILNTVAGIRDLLEELLLCGSMDQTAAIAPAEPRMPVDTLWARF